MSAKKNLLIQVFIGILAFAGSVYVFTVPANSLLTWYNIDDAFYYYKVALNVLSGHGFTFDGINLTNGFHPLWMVVCLGVFWLGKFNLILPLRVLVLVSGLFNAATAIFLYRLLSRFLHPLAALAGSVTWGLYPAIYNITTVHGMESSISAFFIILLLDQAARLLAEEKIQKITPAKMANLGLIGALTILSRLDNVFVVAFIGLFVLFRIRKISAALLYDWVALGLAVVLSWIMRIGLSQVEYNIYSIYPMVGIAFVINPIVYYFFGMYNGFEQKSLWSKIVRQVLAAAVNTAAMLVLAILLNRFGILKVYSQSVIVIFGAVSFIFILCVRLLPLRNTGKSAPDILKAFWDTLQKSWKTILFEGIGYAIPIGLILGGYCVINKIFFGTFTPVSGQIKTWWSTLPNTVYGHKNSLITILGLSSSSAYGPWSLITGRIDRLTSILVNFTGNSDSLHTLIFLLLTLIFVSIVVAIFKADNHRLMNKFFDLLAPALIIGCLVQIAYYTTIGYQHTRVWYWVGEMFAITILASVLLDGLFTWIENVNVRFRWVSLFLTCGLIVFIAAGHIRNLQGLAPAHVTKGNETAYLNEVHAVEDLTPKGSYIGMTGGGLTAYFIQDRTVVNLDGLINSAEYFQAMKAGTAKEFLDAIPLNYVYGNQYVVEESDPYKDILSGRLIEVGFIRGYENFTLYKYVINQ